MVDSGGFTDVPRLAPPVPAPGDKEQKKKKNFPHHKAS